MTFSELIDPEHPRIDAYDATHFRLGNQVFAHALLLLPDASILPWQAGPAEALTAEDLDPLFRAQPQILLIGTGSRSLCAAPALMAAGAARGIGMEWMRTGAACRTYNLLAAEGRRVAAGLLLDRA